MLSPMRWGNLTLACALIVSATNTIIDKIFFIYNTSILVFKTTNFTNYTNFKLRTETLYYELVKLV